MFPLRLVQLIEDHADKLSEGLARKVSASERCRRLVQLVPGEEMRRRSYEIYRNLGEWLTDKTESEIEERYVGIGRRRALQGVPYTEFLWAVTLTKESLWEYLQREGLLEDPVELFGEMELLHTLERFFECAVYYAAVGYEGARAEELHTEMPRVVAHRQCSPTLGFCCATT